MRVVSCLQGIGLSVLVSSCSPELLFQAPDVSSISVTGPVAQLSVGEAVTLSALVRQGDGTPLEGAPVQWQSTNPTVATVSAEGRVVAIGAGTTGIRASFAGVTGLYGITVRPPVATVTLSPAAATLAPGGTQQLTATLRDASNNVLTGRTIAWSSSNTAVAAVSATGAVTAGGAAVGTATITATSEGRSGTATLTVSDNVVSTVTVTGGTGVNAIGFRGNVGTLQLTATARSGFGNTIVTPITWTSNTTTIATVNASGLVTFVGGTGLVTITGTATGAGNAGANVSGTAAFTVAPTLVNGVTRVGAMAAGGGVDFAFSADRVGATTFTAVTSGGTGDGDLYVFAPGVTNGTTSDAGGSNFLCRSWNSGNGESCPIATVVPGWYRLRLHAFTPAGAVSGMNLTLTHP